MAEKVLRDLNLSSQEMGRFATALKDPKFMELLNEYAQEISEPMNKQEAESYVKMVEERSRSKGFSMEGKELVIPTPDSCVKTKDKKTGRKFFINICHSDKLSESQNNARADGSGIEWQIPYSLSPIHKDKDKVTSSKEGVSCERSISSSSNSNSKCNSQGSRHTQDKTTPSFFPANGSSNSYLGHENEMEGREKLAEELDVIHQHEKTNTELKRNEEGSDSLPPPPHYEIIYRHGLDFGKFWMHSDPESNKELERPEEIILRVRLPEVVSAGEILLDVSDTRALLEVPGRYKLQIKWRYLVDSSKALAKFDKINHKLEVTLPTCVVCTSPT